MSIKKKITFLVVVTAISSLLVIGAVNITTTSNILEKNYSQIIHQQSIILQQKLDSSFLVVEKAAFSISDFIISNIPSSQWLTVQDNAKAITDNVEKLLISSAGNIPYLSGMYVHFSSEITRSEEGVFIIHNPELNKFTPIKAHNFSSQDKNSTKHNGWEYIPQNDENAVWLESYSVLSNSKNLVSSYIVPLYLDNTFIGVFGIDIDIDILSDLHQTSQMDLVGDAFIANDYGKILSYIALPENSMMNTILENENAILQVYKNAFFITDELASLNFDGTKVFLAFETLRNGMQISVATPEKTTKADLYSMVIRSAIITGIINLLTIFWAMATSKSIAKPLVKTSSMLKDISTGGGDLTKRLKVDSENETGLLASYFNSFMEFLYDMISQIKSETIKIAKIKDSIKNNTTSVFSDATIIANGINDLNFQTEEQASVVSETSTTLQQIASNIEKLSYEINEQSAAVTESSAAIQQMLSNITSIATNLNKASESFNMLKDASLEGSSAISNVETLVQNMSSQSTHLLETNAVINSIAEQTNLLAMNAAIEAAHAGEAGKGFAVVADEIRKLAENSATQSKDIAKELNTIVHTIDSIVNATTAAESSFETVTERISMVSGLVNEITMAMQEQSDGSRQVLEALQNIQETTLQIQSGSQEMNTGTSSILKEIGRLEAVAKRVQSSSREMARAVETINNSITDMQHGVKQNELTVQSLNYLTDQFVL